MAHDPMSRPQFSIRTLLWLTLVVAAFLGGMAAQYRISGNQATKREIELNEALRELGWDLRSWVRERNSLQQAIEQQQSESRPTEKRYIKDWPIPDRQEMPNP